jgi:hypothetical protein
MEKQLSDSEKEKLWSEYESALKSIKSISKGQGVEKKYGMAYQALVKAGLAPQIRKKYRG